MEFDTKTAYQRLHKPVDYESFWKGLKFIVWGVIILLLIANLIAWGEANSLTYKQLHNNFVPYTTRTK